MVWPFKSKNKVEEFVEPRVKIGARKYDFSMLSDSLEDQYLNTLPNYKKLLQVIDETKSLLRKIQYDERGNRYTDIKVLYNNFIKSDPDKEYRTLAYTTIKRKISESKLLIKKLEILFVNRPDNLDLYNIRSIIDLQRSNLINIIKKYNDLVTIIGSKKFHLGTEKISLDDA